MKAALNWLKQYVDFNWSPAELAEGLTLPGNRHKVFELVLRRTA
jgi:hypothetical protein